MVDSGLTDKQEALLERYYDGECRFFEKGKAKRLLDENPDALSYIESLKVLSKKTQQAINEGYTADVDLWDKISNRIDQEEYAAIFQGERKAVKEEKTPWYSGIGWAVPGAALSAIAFFMVSSNPAALQEGDLPTGSPIPLGYPTGEVSPISVNPVAQNSLSSQAERQFPNTFVRRKVPITRNIVEVDWMRSDGRVRLIDDPEESGAIIWIKRRKPSIPLAGARNTNQIEVIDENVSDSIVIGAK